MKMNQYKAVGRAILRHRRFVRSCDGRPPEALAIRTRQKPWRDQAPNGSEICLQIARPTAMLFPLSLIKGEG